MRRVIEITINSQGETSLQTKGFSGASCREASQFLEQALGKATSETLTTEFHQQVTQESFLRQRE